MSSVVVDEPFKLEKSRFPEVHNTDDEVFIAQYSKCCACVVATSKSKTWNHKFEEDKENNVWAISFGSFPNNVNLKGVNMLIETYKADEIFIDANGRIVFYFNKNSVRTDFRVSRLKNPDSLSNIEKAIQNKQITPEKTYSVVESHQSEFCHKVIALLISVTNLDVTNCDMITSDVVRGSMKRGGSSFKLTLRNIVGSIDVIEIYQVFFNNVIDENFEIADLEWCEKSRSLVWKIEDTTVRVQSDAKRVKRE